MTWARASELTVFAAVAVVIHIAAFLSISAGVPGDAGASGQGDVILQAMTPRMAAMIASIDLADEVETPDTDTAQTVPQVAASAIEHIESPRSEAVSPSASTPEPVANDFAALAPAVPSAEAAASGSDASAGMMLAQTPNAAVAVPVEPKVGPSADRSPETATLASPSTPPSAVVSSSRNLAPTPAPEVLSALPRDDSGSELAPELSRIPPPRPYRESTEPAPEIAAPRTSEPAPPEQQRTQQRQTNRQATATRPSTEQNAQRAAGQGGGQKAGARRSGEVSLSNAKRQNLKAKWGNQIRARIERRKPNAGGERGAVGVRIAVTVQGQLAGVSIAQSSGNGTLDRAAVNAVQRAGRFPRAPKGVSGSQHVFTLTIKFGR